MWKVGDRLGRFRLDREVGQGSHGVVFVATDTALDAQVAVKILHPWLTQDTAVRDRFKRELLLARRIAHPGVCRLFDLHEEGEAFFITMEYVEGQTLLNILKNEGRLQPLRAVRILRGVCQALAAAHNAGVIHRDLKPANIIVRAGDSPMILDFGTATAGDVSRVTRPGTAVGSMRFIAPEVFTGVSPSIKTDTYSLGVVAYVTLAGKLPYNAAAGAIEMLELIRTQPPAKLNVVQPDVSGTLADVVAKAMEKQPEVRFQNAQEFDDALAVVEAELGSGTVRLSQPAPPASTPGAPPASPAEFSKWAPSQVVKAAVEGTGKSKPSPRPPGSSDGPPSAVAPPTRADQQEPMTVPDSKPPAHSEPPQSAEPPLAPDARTIEAAVPSEVIRQLREQAAKRDAERAAQKEKEQKEKEAAEKTKVENTEVPTRAETPAAKPPSGKPVDGAAADVDAAFADAFREAPTRVNLLEAPITAHQPQNTNIEKRPELTLGDAPSGGDKTELPFAKTGVVEIEPGIILAGAGPSAPKNGAPTVEKTVVNAMIPGFVPEADKIAPDAATTETPRPSIDVASDALPSDAPTNVQPPVVVGVQSDVADMEPNTDPSVAPFGSQDRTVVSLAPIDPKVRVAKIDVTQEDKPVSGGPPKQLLFAAAGIAGLAIVGAIIAALSGDDEDKRAALVDAGGDSVVVLPDADADAGALALTSDAGGAEEKGDGQGTDELTFGLEDLTPDAGPEVAAGDDPPDAGIDVASLDPVEKRDSGPTKVRRGPPREVFEAAGAVKATMNKKGLISGDVKELDATLAKASAASRSGRYDSALSLFRDAKQIADKQNVDRAFIMTKLGRFNKAYDRSNRAIADKVEPLARDAAASVASNKYDQANKKLNQAFLVLAKKK